MIRDAALRIELDICPHCQCGSDSVQLAQDEDGEYCVYCGVCAMCGPHDESKVQAKAKWNNLPRVE